jgi:TusA-related sulfurtransferase
MEGFYDFRGFTCVVPNMTTKAAPSSMQYPLEGVTVTSSTPRAVYMVII